MESGKYDSSREEEIPDSESQQDIWRGWSFPVGGSTPDRHKLGGGTPLPCSCGGGSFRSGMQSPTGAVGGSTPNRHQIKGRR